MRKGRLKKGIGRNFGDLPFFLDSRAWKGLGVGILIPFPTFPIGEGRGRFGGKGGIIIWEVIGNLAWLHYSSQKFFKRPKEGFWEKGLASLKEGLFWRNRGKPFSLVVFKGLGWPN